MKISAITRLSAMSALLMVPARVAEAQWNVSQYEAGRSWMYASYGLDPAFVATLGYARSLPALRNMQVAAEVGSVVAKPDLGDSRALVGVRGTAFQWRSVRLTGSGSVTARQTSNTIYRGLSVGAATTWTLGVYRSRWFTATEAGFDKSFATRLRHTDWYRENIYPDAKDGWYGSAAGTIHAGFAGGARFGRTELVARIGAQRSERFNEILPPGYVSLGAGFALK